VPGILSPCKITVKGAPAARGAGHALSAGAPDDMTGVFWPHLGDADRAASAEAAGVCLLGLAFGDPGKFLKAGGHVLV
jgi:hypothetical protein